MKRKNVFIIISFLMLPLLSCTSFDEAGVRAPNSESKKEINKGVDVVDTPSGSLFIEWINKENMGDESSHTPVYSSVYIKVSVVCKGSSKKVLKLERTVCSYDGYEHVSEKANKVGLAFSEQLKAVASVTPDNQLKVNPENDEVCNSALIQDLSVKEMCQ